MKLEPLLYVSDLKKSIEFYCDLLGFQLGDVYPDDKNSTYAPIFIGENKLMLVAARESNRKFRSENLGGSGVQLFIQIADVDKKWFELRDKALVIDQIETKNWGDREFSIKDPDGYLISFYSPTQ